MPELPDVAIFKKYLDSTSLHKKIRKVHIRSSKILSTGRQKLSRRLKGSRLESSLRHGKHLLVELDSDHWLTLHFGMTGFLKYFKDKEGEPSHARLILDFENGYHLAYDCQRLLGEVGLTGNPEDFIQEKELGPDALEINRDDFLERLEQRRGAVKSTLMNQKFLAGIGNVYADEILFHARVHPETKVPGVEDPARKKIYQSMRRVLRKTIDFQADPERAPRSYLLNRRKEGKSCPGCSGEIKKTSVNGRSTYFCPSCQS